MNPTQNTPGQNINKQNIKQPQRTAAGETSEPNTPLDPSGADDPNAEDEVTGEDDDDDEVT